jgi:hypothetical protein
MKIDLGQKYDGPVSPMDDSEDSKTSYPSLYFTCDEECDIPDEGTAVITFRKVEDAENTRDPEDPKYRYELEVQSIDVKNSGGKDASPDVAAALKKAIRDKMVEKLSVDDGE